MNKNKCELIGYYGSDTVIASSAWTSTNRDLSKDKIKRIPKLIDMLWSNGHETPFEKASVHFLVDTDIATHIHLLKHRISSLNAESARYKELKEDKYYLPEDWKDIYLTSKICTNYDDSLSVQWVDQNSTLLEALEEYTSLGNRLYHEAIYCLEPHLGRKRAKESARFFKTYNSQIQADIQFNMRSFANFQKLRNSEHAQLEVRELSQLMLDLVKHIEGNPFEHTIKSWEQTKSIP